MPNLEVLKCKTWILAEKGADFSGDGDDQSLLYRVIPGADLYDATIREADLTNYNNRFQLFYTDCIHYKDWLLLLLLIVEERLSLTSSDKLIIAIDRCDG